MLKYVKMRSPSGPLSPLFITPTNNPMSQSWFSHHLAQVVAKYDLPSGRYSGHSFRIGAATSAALQGVSKLSMPKECYGLNGLVSTGVTGVGVVTVSLVKLSRVFRLDANVACGFSDSVSVCKLRFPGSCFSGYHKS